MSGHRRICGGTASPHTPARSKMLGGACRDDQAVVAHHHAAYSYAVYQHCFTPSLIRRRLQMLIWTLSLGIQFFLPVTILGCAVCKPDLCNSCGRSAWCLRPVVPGSCKSLQISCLDLHCHPCIRWHGCEHACQLCAATSSAMSAPLTISDSSAGYSSFCGPAACQKQ